MSVKVAADLRAAADVIERDGWTQGRYHSADGCHCALGAIVVATTGRALDPDVDDEAWTDRYRTAVAVLDRHIGRHTPSFNDDPSTTADEVTAALRSAAAAVEAVL